MKLSVMHGVGKELTRDELKNVFGGSESLADLACDGKTLNASCSFSYTCLGEVYYAAGICKPRFCQDGKFSCDTAKSY